MTKLWKVTSIAAAVAMTLLCLAAASAGFASCVGCSGPRAAKGPLTIYAPSDPDRGELERAAIERTFSQAVRISVSSMPKKGEHPRRGSGTGVVVSRGKVLTALHVVKWPGEDVRALVRPFEGDDLSPLNAEVIAVDQFSDLALLSVPGLFAPEGLPLARELPSRFSRVLVIGYAAGIRTAVSEEFLIGIHEVDMIASGFGDGEPALDLTGGFMYPGMSGGPVVNARGELIGISEACFTMITPQGMPDIPVPELGSATPLAAVKAFLSQNKVAFREAK